MLEDPPAFANLDVTPTVVRSAVLRWFGIEKVEMVSGSLPVLLDLTISQKANSTVASFYYTYLVAATAPM